MTHRAPWLALFAAVTGFGIGAVAEAAWAREGDPIAKVYLDDVLVPEKGSQVELRLRVLSAYGEPVEGVTIDQLAVSDSGQAIDPAALELRSQDPSDAPLGCLIALDTRVLPPGDAFDRARGAVLQLLEQSDDLDRIAVVTFGEEVVTLLDFEVSRDEAIALLEQYEAPEETEKSRLFDGTYTAIALARNAERSPRRSFAILISDGRDHGSQRTARDIVALAGGGADGAPIPVFSIGHAPKGPDKLRVLANLSETTGAGYFRANSTIHLKAIVRGIWNQMKNGYVARFPGNMDGEIHEIGLRGGNSTATRSVRFPLRESVDLAWLALPLGAGLILVGLARVFWVRRFTGAAGSLVFESGDLEGQTIPIRKKSIRIGALRTHNDIVIAHEAASRQHAVLRRKGDLVELEDLNSTNGTFVNGQRIDTAALAPGDRILIADVAFRYEA